MRFYLVFVICFLCISNVWMAPLLDSLLGNGVLNQNSCCNCTTTQKPTTTACHSVTTTKPSRTTTTKKQTTTSSCGNNSSPKPTSNPCADNASANGLVDISLLDCAELLNGLKVL